MNVGSLHLEKIQSMKTAFIFKMVVVLPSLLFVSYVLMTILGCTACLFGLGDKFYCGPYCFIGQILLGLHGCLLFLYYFSGY